MSADAGYLKCLHRSFLGSMSIYLYKTVSMNGKRKQENQEWNLVEYTLTRLNWVYGLYKGAMKKQI